MQKRPYSLVLSLGLQEYLEVKFYLILKPELICLISCITILEAVYRRYPEMSPDLLQTKFSRFFTNAGGNKKTIQNENKKKNSKSRGAATIIATTATKRQRRDSGTGSKSKKAARESSSDEDSDEDEEGFLKPSNKVQIDEDTGLLSSEDSNIEDY